MKLIGQFDTRNPDRLSENLDRLQANVQAELQALRIDSMPNLEPRPINGSNVFAAFGVGEIALVDTSLGNVQITLSKPDAPGFAALAKRQAANSVTLVPAGTNGIDRVRINGAAGKSYAAIGLYWLFFDGQNWLG